MLGFFVSAGVAAGVGGGGVVLLGRMCQQMLLQMRFLGKELETELTLIGPVSGVDLLVAEKIGLSTEEFVAFAAIESRSIAFLTLWTV